MKLIRLAFAILLSCGANFALAETRPKLETLTKDLSEWLHSSNKSNLAHWQYAYKDNRHYLQATSEVYGGGELVYQLNAKACIISIPHRFFDLHTYTIGKKLFNTHCQLMLSNTHHRYSDSLDEQLMDYSKRRDTLHNSAILAFQSLHSSAKVIQLHGFNQSKRKSDKGQKADFIISQGKKGNVIKQELTLCLSKISKNSYFYPELIQELGGTKNILQKLNLTSLSFIHIEISKTMRERLIKEQLTMNQFSKCINQII